MQPQKPKGTRTIDFLRGTNPKRGFDGSANVVPPTDPIPPNTIRTRASCWNTVPKVDYDPAQVAEGLAQAEDRVLYFLDTSMFDTQTDHRIWEALLSRKHKLAIIPEVRKELRPWIDKHPDHIAAKAVTGDAEALMPKVGIDPSHQATVAVTEYYVNLLAIRKKVFRILDHRFEQEQGRPPDPKEMKKIREDAHNRGIGPRGYLLAKKGEKDTGSPNFYTDEILVTLAVITGLERYREVVILTKDEDLQEQLYKLLYLMDTQYRGMLLADRYKNDRQGLLAHTIPTDSVVLASAFDPCEGVLIERTETMAEDLLPRKGTVTSLHCWVMGKTFSQLSFGAHSDMRSLLPVKGRTKGLNTELLDGQNCHFWLAPLPLLEDSLERKCAAIARDRLIEVNSTRIPMLDLNQAIACEERFKHLFLDEGQDTSPNGQGPNAA